MQKPSYKINQQHNSESGAYIVTLMIILFGLLMMLSLAVDTSLLYLRNMQFKFAAQAASSAALAAQMSASIYNSNGDLENPPGDSLKVLAQNIVQANIKGMSLFDTNDPSKEMPSGSYQVTTNINSYDKNEQLEIVIDSAQTSLSMSIMQVFKGKGGKNNPESGAASNNSIFSATSTKIAAIQPANIVLILDVSGSMLCSISAGVANPLTGSCNDPIPPDSDGAAKRAAEEGRRIGSLKEAVRSFLAKFNPERHRIAIIPFSFAAWKERALVFGNVDSNWFTDIDDLDTGTYTNPSDAFHQILSDSTLNLPNTIFVFFSDGAPQAGRLLLANPREQPSANGMPTTQSAGATNYIEPNLHNMDYVDWPTFHNTEGAAANPLGYYSSSNRPNYLSNYHSVGELPNLNIPPSDPLAQVPNPNDDTNTGTRYFDYYHYTEDCFPADGDTTGADPAYEKYKKLGKVHWLNSSASGIFRCPSALIRTPPEAGRFRLVGRNDSFFRSWPASGADCVTEHDAYFGNPIDTTGFVNINCENIWLKDGLKPLLWRLFAPCSVHRAAYWDPDSQTRRTMEHSMPVPGSIVDTTAPLAFANCVEDLSFYLPTTGGVPITSQPDSLISQAHVPWNDYSRIYYHNTIAMADTIRNSGRLIYVIGLGPDPDGANVITPGGQILPYNDIDNDFERKDFFLGRIALDPFVNPYIYGTDTSANPNSRNIPDLRLNVNFDVIDPALGNHRYTWNNAVQNNELFLGEYIPVSDADTLTQVFDRIARKILLARLR